MNNLYELLVQSERQFSRNIFLKEYFTQNKYSYEDLLGTTNALIARLATHSLKEGDIVALFTNTGVNYFPVLFACAFLNLKLLPLNHQLPKILMTETLSRENVKFILSENLSLKKLLKETKIPQLHSENLFDELNIKKIIKLNTKLASKNLDFLRISSSGTTGEPKTILISQDNLLNMCKNFTETYEYREKAVFLSVMPYHHINPVVLTGLACIRNGANILLATPFGPQTALKFWKIVKEEKVEVISITPAIAQLILQSAKEKVMKHSHLKFAFVGTDYLNELLWRQFEEKFSVKLYQGYGLTETTTWATMIKPNLKHCYNSVGVPVNCQVKILKTSKKSIVKYSDANLQTGEILIKGKIVSSGYANSRQTKKYFKDGWFHTGDLGYFNKNKELVYVGRIKNIIKRKGQLIAPEEITKKIKEIHFISEACTLGIKDYLLGQKLVVFYNLSRAFKNSEIEIRQKLSEVLSPEYFPDQFIQVKEFPKSNTGKINVSKTRDLFNGVAVDTVLQELQKNRYKKDSPRLYEEAKCLINSSILESEKMNLILYWGASERQQLNELEKKALDQFRQIKNTLNKILGIGLFDGQLIFTDTHGKVNGIADKVISSYFRSLKNECQQELKIIKMSQLWGKNRLSFENKLNVFDENFNKEWSLLNGDFKDKMLKQSLKHSKNINELSEISAKKYYLLNQIEKKFVEKKFSNSILLSYFDSSFSILLPQIPTFFLYPHKKGNSIRPWFT